MTAPRSPLTLSGAQPLPPDRIVKGAQEAEAALYAELNSERASVRQHAVVVASKFFTEHHEEDGVFRCRILQMLQDDASDDVRLDALNHLDAYLTYAARRDFDACLLRMFREDPSENVRRQALQALDRELTGDARLELLKAVDDPSHEVVRELIGTLQVRELTERKMPTLSALFYLSAAPDMRTRRLAESRLMWLALRMKTPLTFIPEDAATVLDARKDRLWEPGITATLQNEYRVSRASYGYTPAECANAEALIALAEDVTREVTARREALLAGAQPARSPARGVKL